MLHPLMLLGLAGLAIPVILHLIQKQRMKPQMLATLRFLEPQDAANAFAPVPRDLLQLLLRLALLALFVLLMARLFTTGGEVGPRSMVVVLDQSLAMQRRVDGQQSLFDRHKAEVLDLIDGMGPDDKMALILAGDRINIETGLLRDKEELRRIAEGFEPSDGGGLALGLAVRRAAGLLAGKREVNACVLVFSDHSRASYQPALDEARRDERGPGQALRDSLARGRARLFLIDDEPPEGVNLSIEKAIFSPSSVHVGAGSRLTAVVRNHSDKPQTTQVRLFEGEQGDPPRSLTLEPGEAAHIDLVHRFESPVDSACRVEIEEDVLPGDNRFHLPMRVRDRRQVLLVSPAAETGEGSLEITHRAVDLLAYALNPGEALGRGGGTFVSVKRVSPQGLLRVSLPLYSVVILMGVADLPEQTTKDLQAFVDNGGGLWLIPEGDVSPLRFQAAFEKLLGSFTLGPLQQPDAVQGVLRDEARVNHPLLLPLLREEWGNLREITFGQYHAVQSLGTAQVALRASNGAPLLAVVNRDQGHVAVQLFGTSLDGGSLARTTAFVPLVQQLASFLGARREQREPDVMRVGEVRPIELPEFRGLKGDVVLAGPERATFPLVGDRADRVRVEGLSRAGAYQVSHPSKRTSRQRWLTVNAAAGASDLRPLGEEEQAELFGETNVARLTYARLAGEFNRHHEVFPFVVVLVFLAFAVEAGIGAWQSRRRSRRGKEAPR